VAGLTAYLWVAVDLGYELGISDARYNSLPIGATQEQVRQTLGAPEHRYTRDVERPEVVHHIHPLVSGGHEPRVSDWDAYHADMRQRTAEVWRWSKGLRIICMVFDGDGKVIFKYVDA